MSTHGTQLRPRQVFAAATVAYLKAFLQNGALLLTTTLFVGLLAVALLSTLPALARLQLPLVLDASGAGVSAPGFSLLLAEVAIPGTVIVLLVLGVSYVGMTRLLYSALGGARVRFGASLVCGLRRCGSAAVAFLAVALAVALLAVAAPLLMVLGALGLVAAGASRIAKRRLPLRTRWLVAAIIPCGLACVAAWRGSLAVPLVALEGQGPFAAIRRSVLATGNAPWFAPLSPIIAFIAYFALQALVGLAGPAGAPPLAVTLLGLFTQALTFGFPMAVLVVLTLALRDPSLPVGALPALRRPVRITATAATATLALVLGFLVPVVPVAAAFAEEPGSEPDSSEVGEIGALGETPPEEPGESGGTGGPGETGGSGETPPMEPGGDEPEGALTPLDFRPVLHALEGELTAPGQDFSLQVLPDLVNGQRPYTFYATLYLLIEGRWEQVGPAWQQSSGSLGYPEVSARVSVADWNLGVGQQRFRAETKFKANRNDTGGIDGLGSQQGPTLEYTHTIGTIDASTRVTLTASPSTFVADESVELTAVVEGDSGRALAGSVTFQRIGDPPTQAVTVDVDSTGTARTGFSGLPVGAHSFTATYRYLPAGVLAESDMSQVTVLPYPVALELSPPAAATEYGAAADFGFILRAPRGGIAPTGTIELRRDAGGSGAALDSITLQPADFVDGAYRGVLGTDALGLGDTTVAAIYTSGDGQHQAGSSEAVTHRVAPVPVTLEIGSIHGWSLPRGSSPAITVDIVIPEGSAPLPGDGTIELEVGDTSYSIPLSSWQTSVWQQLTDISEDLDITASLGGYTTHRAAPATAKITTRAAQTQVSLAFDEPALPGKTQGFSARVAGETDRSPVDGRVEVRVKGTSAWKPLPLSGTTRLDFGYVLGLGEHTIEARYVSARPNEFTDSEISELVVRISRSVTQLTATAPMPAPRVGEAYRVAVQASNQEPYPVLSGPEGTVTAVRDGRIVASVALSGGGATLDIPASTAGDDELSIQYEGSDTHSSAETGLSVPIGLWPSTVSFAQNPTAPVVGEAVELTATVSSELPAELGAVIGGTVVGGTVEFSRGGLALGTALVAADGTAVLTATAPLTPGTATLQARYLGADGSIAAGDTTASQTVVAAPTTLDFTVTPETTHSRDLVEITVRIGVDPRTTLSAESGSVTLTGSLVGSARMQALGADGTARFSVIAPVAEGQPYDFTLQYSGTAQLAGSQASGAVRVDAAPVSVGIDASDRIVAGESTVVAVQLSTAGATPIPSSGNVDLYADGTLIGSKTLAMGIGSRIEFTVAAPAQLVIGEHRLTARFRNSFGYQPAASNPKAFTVLGRETEVQLALDPGGSTPAGTPVTVTATVNVVWSDDAPYGQLWLRKAGSDEVLDVGTLGWSNADRTKATFILRDLPIGVHEWYAEYLPSGASATMNAGSVSGVQRLEVTGRDVTVVPIYGAPRIGQDTTVLVDVRDPNAAGGSAPGGEVDVLLGDTVVGTGTTMRTDDALRSRATVTVPLQRLLGGDQRFTVWFRSIDGIHSFVERSDTVHVAKLTPQLTIQPVGDLSRLRWGDDFYVNVYLNRSTEPGALAVQPPSGALTVGLAQAGGCVPVVAQQYRCRTNVPGQVVVTATVAGDTNYAAGEASLALATANRRTPTLTVDLQPYSFPVETGTRQHLSWRLDGPSDGPLMRPTITGLPAGASCTGGASGSCEFDFDLTTAGAPRQLAVVYPGDGFWEPVSWQQSITPVGCYPLTLRAEPSDAGVIAVAAVDGARCANGTGYRAGTRVGIRATPADTGVPGWSIQLDSVGGRAGDAAVGGLHWFTVGTGAGEVSQIVARFISKEVCYPVTIQDLTFGSGSLGYTVVDTQPNCASRTRWESTSSPQQNGWRSSSVVGWYQAGTRLTASAVPFSSGEFYAARLAEDVENRIDTARWDQAMPQAFTVDRALRVQTRFGVPCLPVTVSAAGPGAIERITAPNCDDTFRADQFQQGTEVYWLARPHVDEYGYVASTRHAETVPLASGEQNARTGVARFRTAAFAGMNTAQLTFDRCRTLTLKNLSPELGTFSAWGSNCPVGSATKAEEASGIYRFTPGSEVQLSAYPKGMSYAAPRFSSWNWPAAVSDPKLAALDLNGSATFAISDDLTLRPSFVRPGECSLVTVASGDPLVEVSVDGESAALERCREGGLVAGWTSGSLSGETGQGSLITRARATDGNPKLGWVITGTGADPAQPRAGAATPGASIDVNGAGGRTLTAYSCQEVSPYIGITDVSGEFGMALQRGGTFIEISPAPNCPFSPTAYTIGTELTITAGADERGYVFHGWGGVAEANAGAARSATYTVQNNAPAVAVTALYEVVCHTLTITGKAHRVTAMPAPNCPGAPNDAPSADNGYTGRYIGGTPVAMIGEVPGGNVWQGWRGDLVETGKVKVAVAVMDADKTAEHRYRGKSWDEKAVDFFEDMGDALAVAGKKMLGGVAYIAGKYAAEIPPLGLLGEAFEVISLVGEVLNFIGVPKSITKYFDYPAQTLDWVMSGFTCLASASFSSQNGGKSANLSGWADDNQQKIDDTGGQFFRAIGIDPGEDNELVGETLEKLYVAGKSLSYAQKYTGGGESIGKAMDTIDAGLEIYGMVTGPQGVGWDSSASDAFDKDYGSHIAGCMAAATPDFIRGALPISKKDFDSYEEDYGL